MSRVIDQTINISPRLKAISSSLAVGSHVDWSTYNVYTVANVAKRFLLSVPGGLFGELNEAKLLDSAAPQPDLSTPSTPATPKGSIRLPLKLVHTPGFRTPEPVALSPLVTDSTGYLSDFGLGSLTRTERVQVNLFIE